MSGAFVGAGNSLAPASVVEQNVHGFLQHPLFIADDDFRRVELHKAFQPVVPVDNPAVQIIQIAGGETAALQGHQRAKVRRQHRNHVHDHPFGTVAGIPEGLYNTQTLGQLLALCLAGGFRHFLAKYDAELCHVLGGQHNLDGFGPDTGFKIVPMLFTSLAITFLAKDLSLGKRGFLGIYNYMGLEIQNLFEVFQRKVQQVAYLGRQAFKKPDMGHRRRQFDMSHALAAYLGLNNFHAAFFTDHTAVLHALVFTAITLVILGGAENFGAKESIPLGLERPIVDGLRLFHFAEGPFADFFRRGQCNPHGVKAQRVFWLLEVAKDIFQGLYSSGIWSTYDSGS